MIRQILTGITNPELRPLEPSTSSDVPDYLPVITGRLLVTNNGKPESKWI